MTLRREMDRLFDQFSRGFFDFPRLTFGAEAAVISPQIDIREADGKLEVIADLPGLDQNDVQVELANNVLTIRGEKKSEREEKKADYHLQERSFGSFLRSFPLPFEANPDQVEAKFDKGVLTISVPKPAEVQQATRRIQVKGGAQAAGAQAQGGAAEGGATQAGQG